MLGFSGTRRLLRAHEKHFLTDFLRGLGDWDGFVTGGCTGIDHFVGSSLFRLFPERHHMVIVPANRSRVAAWWRDLDSPNLEVIEMPPGTDYWDRNIRIVARCSWLAGFPAFPVTAPASNRSGTWQTIRLARTAADAGNHIAKPLVVPLSTLGA